MPSSAGSAQELSGRRAVSNPGVGYVTSAHRLDERGPQRVRVRLREVLPFDQRVAFAFASFGEDRPFHDVDVGI
jgi:hypothetical protein